MQPGSDYRMDVITEESRFSFTVRADDLLISDPVTTREHEVLQLISDGDSAKMIADKLHISETTAITHRKNLIRKLKVKNTAQLIKVAVLCRLVF